MPDFQPPQWSEFKVPGGGADLSYVGPVANAYASAAEMATRPLNRMLEQVLSSRLQEKATLQQQQYAAQQQTRAFQDQTMRDRLNDAAALERINVEYDRRAEMERIAQEEKARQAQILTSTLWDGGAAMASPTGGVAPGTGPLKFEDVYGAGPQQGFAPPPPGLDPTQIGTVYNAQAIRAERNQNNAEQAAKDARAQATAQAQAQAATTAISQAPVPPEVKAALMGVVNSGDPDGAARQLAEMLKPAPARALTEAEIKKGEGYTQHNFGGGSVDLPNMLFENSPEFALAEGDIRRMPAKGKAALELQAGKIAGAGLSAEQPLMAAAMASPNVPPEIREAYEKMLKDRTDKQFKLLAQSLGWKDEAQILQDQNTRLQKQAERTAIANQAVPYAMDSTAPKAGPKLEMNVADRLLTLKGGAPDADELVMEGRRTGLFQSRAEVEAWDKAGPEQRAEWLRRGRVQFAPLPAPPAPYVEKFPPR